MDNSQRTSLSDHDLIHEDVRHSQHVFRADSVGDRYPMHLVHELFEQLAAEHPLAPALLWGNQTECYATLNSKANQLAHHLNRLGVGPEVHVAICMERSIEMIVGILAVLKAGGAYVPIDPAYPVERLDYLLSDAGAHVVLGQRSFREILSSEECHLICLDDDSPSISGESTANPSRTAMGENAAYVIYTSGSTGRPKGVVVTHAGLINYVDWAVHHYVDGGGVGVLLHSSLGFDLTVTSLFVPLVSGSPLTLVTEQRELEGLRMALRDRRQLDLLKLTPSHLNALAAALDPASPRTCRPALIVGGEALRFEQLSLWRNPNLGYRIINEYGPTETVVGCIAYEVLSDDPRSGNVPIGTPIANAQIYLLDQHMQPVAAGKIGEIFIGGPSVARGYLRQSRLTAERFLPDPFSETGQRLYRSGDLACERSDGILEFLGRADEQTKIRGHRIEPGEIESALREQPEIALAHVAAESDNHDQPQIVAYLVGPDCPSATELRRRLQTRMPEYMIPSVFIQLEDLPLTIHGKVDREALRKARTSRNTLGQSPELAPHPQR